MNKETLIAFRKEVKSVDWNPDDPFDNETSAKIEKIEGYGYHVWLTEDGFNITDGEEDASWNLSGRDEESFQKCLDETLAHIAVCESEKANRGG